jgi:hypothetical protein
MDGFLEDEKHDGVPDRSSSAPAEGRSSQPKRVGVERIGRVSRGLIRACSASVGPGRPRWGLGGSGTLGEPGRAWSGLVSLAGLVRPGWVWSAGGGVWSACSDAILPRNSLSECGYRYFRLTGKKSGSAAPVPKVHPPPIVVAERKPSPSASLLQLHAHPGLQAAMDRSAEHGELAGTVS